MTMKGNKRKEKVYTDNSDALTEWIKSLKSERTAREYKDRWEIWLQYCRQKAIPDNGSAQLEDMKKRRLSSDNTVKYFYDNEIPKFFQWLKTEYKGIDTKKPLSESSALTVTTAIRSFFSFHRYSLEIKKDALPSSEKVAQKYEDHAFDIYQLRSMFQQGDLKDRTILACSKDLWLRAGDFTSLNRDMIELAIKREEEIAQNEKRDMDIIELETITEKEREPCSCHLSRETVELLKDYLKGYPKTSEKLFPLTEDALNDMLRRLAEKAKITITGRIRWHCLRKFGITLMHGKVTEPVMKYMTGKHISKDLKTYIQNNRETFKAFKLIEPLISLTKTNGNGANQKLTEQLEKIAKIEYEHQLITTILEAILTDDQKQKIRITVMERIEKGKFGRNFITDLAEEMRKKDLERILAENNNNET